MLTSAGNKWSCQTVSVQFAQLILNKEPSVFTYRKCYNTCENCFEPLLILNLKPNYVKLLNQLACFWSPGPDVSDPLSSSLDRSVLQPCPTPFENLDTSGHRLEEFDPCHKILSSPASWTNGQIYLAPLLYKTSWEPLAPVFLHRDACEVLQQLLKHLDQVSYCFVSPCDCTALIGSLLL